MLTASRRFDDVELRTLFSGLDGAPALCLAVSGGPDSVALLALAVRWRALLSQGPHLHVATVDHGLRAGSAVEAAAVAALADRFRLPHTILRWEGDKPATRIQERARAARYALLGAHCRAAGHAVLLTAHHGDDQAETVLMRLGRGSGVAGLAAMRRRTELADGTSLVRPLLFCAKVELVELCRREHLPFVDDPSNADETFHRVRLRRRAADAAALGLTPATLQRLARRMERADEALQAEVERCLALLMPRHAPGGCDVDVAPVRHVSAEILGRLILRLVDGVTGRRPRLDRLERVADALGAALRSRRPFRSTIGGARLLLDDAGHLAIVAEADHRRARARPD